MPQKNRVGRAQAALGEIAFELIAVQERLAAINCCLPVPPNQEAMLEDDICPDVATEMSGCIECIAEDYLRQLIEALEQAFRVTPVTWCGSTGSGKKRDDGWTGTDMGPVSW